MVRQNIAGTSPYEAVVGYARAVRLGETVHIAGTTATDAQGRVVCPGDAYGQAKQALQNIGAALREAGADFRDVVRTRIYVTDIGLWQDVGRAHGEVFAQVRPATTMVQVAALIDPAMLVEIEADAIIASAPQG